MTSESTSTSSTGATGATGRRAGNGEDTATESRDAVQAAVGEVRGALEGVSRSMPEVARASRSAMDDMMRAIETGSDERVSAGVTLSLGLAMGMLLGGAPRILIAAALVPVAAMGIVIMDRRSRTARGTATRS
jgi:hypothetical protein